MKYRRKNHRRILKRLTLGTACLVLTGILLLSLGASPALAFTSLPHIEELVSSLKLSDDSFVILEIVPEAGAGSIGYYINGEEPCAGWTDDMAALTGQQARENYAENLFNTLFAQNLLSSGAATPLTGSPQAGEGYYREVYPWIAHAGMRPLALEEPETAVDVTGDFEETGPATGDYSAQYDYTLAAGGDYVQDIDHFVAADGGEGWYYDVTFREFYVPGSGVYPELTDGLALYTNTDDADPAAGSYVYAGRIGQGLTLDEERCYYSIDAVGAPHAEQTGYRAQSESFSAAANPGEGYFSREITGYTWLGDGSGDWTFTYDPDGAETGSITYSTVFCTGGFVNNNWFARFVLDMDAASAVEIDFIVNSVTPSYVTASMVGAADMIVLSAGQGADLSAGYGEGNDLASTVAKAIYDAAADNSLAAVIADYRLTATDGSNTALLARILIDGAAAGGLPATDASFAALCDVLTWAEPADADRSFVNKNVYCYNPSDALPALATSRLDDPFGEAALAGFEDVRAEIDYENFLRLQEDADTTDLLPTDIAMSTVLRYIINSRAQRTVEDKTNIRVLDLEPARGEYLTAAMVREWLGRTQAELPDTNISVTHMSTAEFVGKIEDLNETYDLIYVGDDTTGMNVDADGETKYNDGDMDGLLYTNIGDEYRSDLRMAGLLDRDYAGGSFTYNNTRFPRIDGSASTSADLFRFSGNDLTQARYEALRDFAEAGYPVIFADKLVEKGSGQAAEYNVSVTISAPTVITDASSFQLTAAITGLPPDARYTCTWYGDYNNQARLGTNIGTGLTLNARAERNNPIYYYCVVTIDGRTARSNTLSALYNDAGDYIATFDNNPTNGYVTYYRNNRDTPYQYSVGLTPNYSPYWDEYTLTASCLRLSNNGTAVYTYAWYKNGVRLTNENGATLTLSGDDIPGSYYCVVNVTQVYRGFTGYNCTTVTEGRSDAVTIAANDNGPVDIVPLNGYPSTVNITIDSSEYLTASPVNGDYVDSSSYMYQALSLIKSKANVLTSFEAKMDTATVRNYLNLSKPDIIFTQTGTDGDGAPIYAGYPTVYKLVNGAATSLTGSVSDGVTYHYLQYDFSIANATDATPATTRYDVRLYLDLNSDGLYSDDEEITDIVVRGADGALISPVNNIYSLKADTRYTVARQMPTDFAGIIPWKLEVVKVGAEHIHASHNDYTRIAPPVVDGVVQSEQINILQIRPNNNNGVNLEYQQVGTAGGGAWHDCYSPVTGRTYNGIYGKLLADVTDFNVDITTETTNQVDAYGTTSAAILAELDKYDMLIIGFDDMYGELSQKAADAIVSFIDTGKAVLFTHDTTSQANVPSAYNSSTQAVYTGTYDRRGNPIYNGMGFGGDLAYWGYYFNTVLRDAVNLDRYGIRSENRNLLVDQDEDTNLTAAEKNILLADDYTVAYTPGTARAGTVAETQGYSNYALIRYGQSTYTNTTSNYSTGRGTSTVSQLNEGQITTYPYDINTADFGGTDADILAIGQNYLTVGETHEPYYQLNMNGEDVVVWYCVSNGAGGNAATDYYAGLPNDAVNAYYIFSTGNITYSGVGHSVAGTANSYQGQNVGASYINEAKLFVNTMIAAYRTVNESPNVSFTQDSTGENDIDYFFLTTEYTAGSTTDGEILETGDSFGDTDESRRVYFKLSDPNLNAEKTITVRFYYEDAEGTVNVRDWSEALDEMMVREFTPTLYLADTNTVAGGNLTGGLIYMFYLPDEILEKLQPSAVTDLRIYIRVETVIGADVYYGQDAIELRKIGLFKLR